ncbi:hypothetical protein Mukteswar_001468 [Burkholderia mallei]|nr:hypothetical protein Zagreb_003315 [Burkholderia mallei]WPJ38809.1 hypothetical protein Mukteswar_001468 [Burkholderia mallei]WPJ43689.1 hypothetical protein Bogor_003398 [Burkholderia mallei]
MPSAATAAVEPIGFAMPMAAGANAAGDVTAAAAPAAFANPAVDAPAAAAPVAIAAAGCAPRGCAPGLSQPAGAVGSAAARAAPPADALRRSPRCASFGFQSVGRA